MKQQPGARHRLLLCVVLLFIALILAQALVGCGSAAQTQSIVTPTAAEQTPPGQSGSTPTAEPTQKPGAQTTSTPAPQSTVTEPVLHGATNFLLTSPFNFAGVHGVTTSDSGASTQLDDATIKAQVTQELKHLLFVVADNDTIKVYSQGVAPVSAQVLPHPDGTASVSYTQTADSEAGSITILFSGLLSKKQIQVSYEQQYTPSMLINAQASDIEVYFTSPVKWVAPNEIPAAPTNGAYQRTDQGGVTLSWTAGQNAAAYDVYRLVSDQNQQFQLLATVKGTSYTDNSSVAIQNIHSTKGITYAIFSVGPTGVENPGGIILSV